MSVALAWLRIDLRLRWRSLLTLALLVAVATGVVLAATAGARRGGSAVDRLEAVTLPANAAVLPNDPRFDWTKVRRLPEVASVGVFAISAWTVEGLPAGDEYTGFPVVGADLLSGLERPVVLSGRLADQRRPDEAVVTARFLTRYHFRVGDVVTARLYTPRQLDNLYGYGAPEPPAGPRQPLRIVGAIRSPWFSDAVGDVGAIQPTAAFTDRYEASIFGSHHEVYANALVRLRGGEGDLNRFTQDLATVTGRHDIDVWNLADEARHARKVTGFESDVLLALAVAAAAAAAVLIGQTLTRYSAASVADLRVLRAAGMTPRQLVAAAACAPAVATLVGTAVGVAAAVAASPLFPIGAAATDEPHPGVDVDALVLGVGGAAVVLLSLAGAVGAAAVALGAERRGRIAPRRSAVARLTARAGLPVPVQVGTRFALEPGGGTSAVPVRPALVGAVVGVLGVLAAFTFRAGVVSTADDPVRFGQTFQLSTSFGDNGQDSVRSAPALRALAADRDVTAVNDTRVGVVSLRDATVTVFSYHPVGHGLRTVVLSGRMPTGPGEIALAPDTLEAAHLHVGDTVPAEGAYTAGGPATGRLRVTGEAFVPEDSHNDYATGAWLTSAGFARLFPGDAFKFHEAHLALRPGTDLTAAAARLSREASAATGGDVSVAPAIPSSAPAEVREVRTLPLILGGFLAVLAVVAVGHALATAVRRRRHDLAVLRALGMTRRQARAVVAVQATVLGLVGVVAGVPLGLVVGRTLWRLVADRMPVLYVAPLAATALAVAVPAVLAVANLLASVFARQAARLRPATVLRAE